MLERLLAYPRPVWCVRAGVVLLVAVGGFNVHEAITYVLMRTTDKMKLCLDWLTDVTGAWQGPNSVFQRLTIHNLIVPLTL